MFQLKLAPGVSGSGPELKEAGWAQAQEGESLFACVFSNHLLASWGFIMRRGSEK